MSEELIPLFAIFFSIGGPVTAFIVWLWLNYQKRRKLMELHHAERMAAIERGMDIPPLPIELIDGRSPRPRSRKSSLRSGLIWFFVGLAAAISLASSNEHDIPMFVALIPLGVGVAFLLYYFLEGRKSEALMFEHDLAQRPNGRQTPTL
jgi:hypothetical protein